MNAGKLDRRVVIQSFSLAQDATGFPSPTTNTLATVWANVEKLRGKEPLQGEQLNAQHFAIFTIRHRTDLDETMKIVFDSETYDIVSIREIGRRDGLEISALALVTT